jgi:hypothetical protein
MSRFGENESKDRNSAGEVDVHIWLIRWTCEGFMPRLGIQDLVQTSNIGHSLVVEHDWRHVRGKSATGIVRSLSITQNMSMPTSSLEHKSLQIFSDTNSS